MLDLEFFELSDVGRVRDHNEDYVGSWIPPSPNEGRTQGWFFALADGVGGEERGEVASRMAVEAWLRASALLPEARPTRRCSRVSFKKPTPASMKRPEIHTWRIQMATTIVAWRSVMIGWSWRTSATHAAI